MSGCGGSKKTLLKQASKRRSFLPSSTVFTLLQRGKGEGPVGRWCWERCLDALGIGHRALEQGSLRGMEGVWGAPAGGTSSLLAMAWAKGQSWQESLPPPALGRSRDMAGSCRIPLPSPAPSQRSREQGKAEAL